jgi:hypothetical protein
LLSHAAEFVSNSLFIFISFFFIAWCLRLKPKEKKKARKNIQKNLREGQKQQRKSQEMLEDPLAGWLIWRWR